MNKKSNISNMMSVFLPELAAGLAGWKSKIIGKVGPANIKVINMTAVGSPIESHDHDEAVSSLTDCWRLMSMEYGWRSARESSS